MYPKKRSSAPAIIGVVLSSLVLLLIVLANLALIGWLIYVANHFIMKFW